MFKQCVRHYHQWSHSTIHFKTKSSQSSPDSLRIQGPSKRPSSGHLYPISSVKERNRKGGKCKISWVLQSPVSSPQASLKVEASNRPKQVQHLPTCRKVSKWKQYLDDWLIRAQSQEEAQVNTQTVVDLTQSLGWIINQEKSETKT